MSEDKRGNETPMHARLKHELCDILLRMQRDTNKPAKIRKEYEVPNQRMDGGMFVVDVADHESERGSYRPPVSVNEELPVCPPQTSIDIPVHTAP